MRKQPKVNICLYIIDIQCLYYHLLGFYFHFKPLLWKSDKFAIYGTVNIVIALRNSYECDIARGIIKIKQRNPNIVLHILLSEHQANRHRTTQQNTSGTKYFDIITSADNLNIIHTTFASGFFRKLLEVISENCNLTLYYINDERYNLILQTIINYHHSFSLSIFDIV